MSDAPTRASPPRALLAAALLLPALPVTVSPTAEGVPSATSPDGGVVGWLGPAPAAAQETGPVTLRLDAEEGETTRYRFRSRTRISPPPGMGMKTTADATMLVRNSVEGVEGDTLRLSSRVDSFALDLTSDNEQVKSQLRQAAERSRKNVVGQSFRMTLTRRGEMVEMGSIGGVPGGTQQLDRSLRQLAFATLPAEPVTVGDSWSSRRTTEAASFGIPVEGQVVTRSTSTLTRIFRRNGSRVAQIDVEATFGFRADSAGAAGMKVDMSGSSAQTIHFDVEEGRFLSSSGAQDFTVNLSLPGQAEGSFTVQGSTETSARLLGVEDGP